MIQNFRIIRISEFWGGSAERGGSVLDIPPGNSAILVISNIIKSIKEEAI